MAGLSQTYESLLLQPIRDAGQAPPRLYAGLFTVAPTDAYTAAVPTGTQVTGGAYAKAAVDFGAITGSPSQCANTNTVTFPTPTANWGTVVAVGIFDRNTGTQSLLAWALLSSSAAIVTGDTVRFPVGSLVMSLD